MINLDGTIDVRMRKGRFLAASGSATGALKMLGIFNFENIIRRLRFDFSDLFSSGVSFDKMGGEFAFSDSTLTLSDPLEITSPSSRFLTFGSVDLIQEQLDMELIATLPIASNLPWIAALISGLPAAAGVYLVSKLFTKQLERFSSAIYRVEGPWADPAVNFQRIFDNTAAQKKMQTFSFHTPCTSPVKLETDTSTWSEKPAWVRRPCSSTWPLKICATVKESVLLIRMETQQRRY